MPTFFSKFNCIELAQSIEFYKHVTSQNVRCYFHFVNIVSSHRIIWIISLLLFAPTWEGPVARCLATGKIKGTAGGNERGVALFARDGSLQGWTVTGPSFYELVVVVDDVVRWAGHLPGHVRAGMPRLQGQKVHHGGFSGPHSPRSIIRARRMPGRARTWRRTSSSMTRSSRATPSAPPRLSARRAS